MYVLPGSDASGRQTDRYAVLDHFFTDRNVTKRDLVPERHWIDDFELELLIVGLEPARDTDHVTSLVNEKLLAHFAPSLSGGLSTRSRYLSHTTIVCLGLVKITTRLMKSARETLSVPHVGMPA